MRHRPSLTVPNRWRAIQDALEKKLVPTKKGCQALESAKLDRDLERILADESLAAEVGSPAFQEAHPS